MRKLKPRMKKIIAMLLVALTINTSISSSMVLPVEAAYVPLASEFVSAMLQVFGYTWGFGTTADGMNNTSSEMFAEMQAKWNAGESFEVDATEIPDLRDAANFTNFVYDSYDFYTSYNNAGVTNEYMTQLNEKAYKATGTLVSKTFLDSLELAKEHIANTSEEVLTEELEAAFSALTDDNAEISNMNTLSLIFGSIIAGIATKSQVDASNTWTNTLSSSVYDFENLKVEYVTVNGYSVPVYMPVEFKTRSDRKSYTYITEYPGDVYVVPFRNGTDSLSLISFSDGPYSYTYTMYKDDGTVTEKTAYATLDSGHNLYTKTMSYVCDKFNFKYFDNTSSVLDNDDIFSYFQANLIDISCYLEKADAMDASVTDALTSYSGRAVTKSKLLELSDALESRATTAAGTETATAEIAATITEAATALPEAGTSSGTGTGEYSSILDKILAAIQAIAAAIWGFFSEPLSGIKSAIDVFPAILEDIGSIVSDIPKTIWEYVEPTVTAIHEEVTAIVSQNTNPWDEDDTERSSDSVSLLNGFALLIFIIIELLKIFWHCLQFIVAIFEIQPSTAFLPDEVIMGLDYLKTLEITGIGLSVYDFLMGLVYILIVFSVVRVLRINIDRIHVPGHGIKKAN